MSHKLLEKYDTLEMSPITADDQSLFPSGKKLNRRQNRRAATRFANNSQVVLKLRKGSTWLGILRDISVDGASVEIHGNLPDLLLGQMGELSLQNPSHSTAAHHCFPCQIVRINETGVSIQFLSDRNC